MQHIHILRWKILLPYRRKTRSNSAASTSPSSVLLGDWALLSAQEHAFVSPRSHSSAWKKSSLFYPPHLLLPMTLCLEQQLFNHVHTCTFDSERFVFIQVSLYYERCLKDHQFFKNYLYKGHYLARDTSIKLVVVYEVLWVSLIWEKCIMLLFIYILSTSTKWMLCCHADIFKTLQTFILLCKIIIREFCICQCFCDDTWIAVDVKVWRRTVRMPWEILYVFVNTLTHPSHIYFRFLTILPWLLL